MRTHGTAAAVAMSLALLACGGGGGGGGGGGTEAPQGPQAATAEVTSANYGATADGAAAATASGYANLNFIAGDGSVTVASAGRATAKSSGAPRAAIGKLLARPASGRAEALAVPSETEPCDSGNLLFAIDEADVNESTPGDTVTVTSQNCVFDGTPVVGSFRLTLASYSETQTQVRVSFTLSLDGFGTQALNFDGNVAGRLVDSADHLTLSLDHQGVTAVGAAAAPVQWHHTVDYALDYNSGDETVSFSGFVGVDGGFVELEQLSPFVLSFAGPSEGRLQITGVNGGRVVIVAGATGYDYEFYAAGNTGTTPDETAAGRAY